MNERSVVIIGGGISGLSTAYFLSRKTSQENFSHKITVLEASDRFGGVVRTLRGKDLHMEAGADAFDGKDPIVLDLCKALGLQEELLSCGSTLSRAFISRNKNLQPLDLSFSDPGRIFRGPGLSLGARARLFCEFMIPSKKKGSDESVASFIRRRFGREVLTKWGEPLVRGILMAEPEKLSLHEYFPQWEKMEREHGSMARAILRKKKSVVPGTFFTLRGGLDRLVSELSRDPGSVDFKTQAPAAVLKRDKTWEVRLRDGRSFSANVVCLALPAPEAARLLAEVAPLLATELAKIRYDSILAVNMVFRREEIPGNFPSSGFVVPSREKKWPFASLKVIGKTEDQKGIRLRAFISGVFQPEVYARENDQVQQEVLRCLAGEWGIPASPSWISVERYPQALAQYEVGHAECILKIEGMLSQYPGLFLAGNGYRGFGIADCIREADKTSEQIVSFRKSAPIPGIREGDPNNSGNW